MQVVSFLNKNRLIVTVIAAACVVLAGYSIYRSVVGDSHQMPKKLYYTTDDGATFFVAAADLVPPFDHDGRQAVRMHFCVVHGQRMPWYLERYSAGVKAEIDKAHGDPDAMNKLGLMMFGGGEVKPPLKPDAPWVRARRPEGIQICAIPGDDDEAHEVFP